MWRAVACLLLLMGQRYLLASQLYEYHLVNKNMTWQEAQIHCRTFFTDLATVTNMADADRLQTEAGGEQYPVWIGLHIPQVNQTTSSSRDQRVWHWSLSGLDFDDNKTNWAEVEPNNVGGHENCGFILENLSWGDVSCNETNSFLCYNERDKSKKRFHLQKPGKTWFEAQKFCRAKFTDLVSGPEQLCADDLKNEIGQYPTWMFIGLFRDTWKWSDGSRFSFRNWSESGEETNKNCTEVNGKVWKPADCQERKPAVCYGSLKMELIQENKTWEDALEYCRRHHHDLLSITSPDEQFWAGVMAKTANSKHVWLGLRYGCALDLWFWVSDQLVRYDNWEPTEPRVDHCSVSGAMKTGGKNEWVSMHDSASLNFLCVNRQL